MAIADAFAMDWGEGGVSSCRSSAPTGAFRKMGVGGANVAPAMAPKATTGTAGAASKTESPAK
jgi:hypothetical protein